jgi:hypothetical protein
VHGTRLPPSNQVHNPESSHAEDPLHDVSSADIISSSVRGTFGMSSDPVVSRKETEALE